MDLTHVNGDEVVPSPIPGVSDRPLSCHRGRLHHPTEPHPPEDRIFGNIAVACIPLFYEPELSLQLIVEAHRKVWQT